MLAVALALTASFAFKPAVKRAGDPVTYHYTSQSGLYADMKDVDNWDPTSGPSCFETGNRPCSIVDFDGDKTALATYLSGFANAAEITNAASDRRTVTP